MPFLEAPRFPELISFHALGGPGFRTTVVEMETGNESRDQAWAQARATYEVSHAARLPAVYTVLQAFFRIAQGRTNGFRFKDWSDCSVAAAESKLLELTATTFQLYKRYTAITGYTGTSTTSLSIATGSKAFTTQSGLSYAVGDRARATNSVDTTQFMEGAVTAYSGTSLTISVDTVGGSGTVASWDVNLAGSVFDRKITKPVKTISVTGGTLSAVDYTTGIVTMTAGTPTAWSGQFDVPCRFDTDEMKGEIIDKSGNQLVMAWNSIPVVEVRP